MIYYKLILMDQALPITLVILSILAQQTAAHSRVIKPPTNFNLDNLGQVNHATIIPGQDLELECSTPGEPQVKFIWEKHNIDDTGTESLTSPYDGVIELNNSRLTMRKPSAKHQADYECWQLENDGRLDRETTNKALIKVRTQPYIENFGPNHTGKSSILIIGDRLELTCTVNDFIPVRINISWYHSASPDDEVNLVPIPVTSDMINAKLDRNNNIIVERLSSYSQRLVIKAVKYSDRNYYVCIATNGISEPSRKIILIRVKDKFVALWPFFGILVELFILFTILFICSLFKSD